MFTYPLWLKWRSWNLVLEQVSSLTWAYLQLPERYFLGLFALARITNPLKFLYQLKPYLESSQFSALFVRIISSCKSSQFVSGLKFSLSTKNKLWIPKFSKKKFIIRKCIFIIMRKISSFNDFSCKF